MNLPCLAEIKGGNYFSLWISIALQPKRKRSGSFTPWAKFLSRISWGRVFIFPENPFKHLAVKRSVQQCGKTTRNRGRNSPISSINVIFKLNAFFTKILWATFHTYKRSTTFLYLTWSGFSVAPCMRNYMFAFI